MMELESGAKDEYARNRDDTIKEVNNLVVILNAVGKQDFYYYLPFIDPNTFLT